jgi:hypothetical protein
MLIRPITLALSLAAFLITSMPAFTTTVSEQQQQGRSEGGGLIASLNGVSFTKGDTVTIGGNVKESSIRSNVWINVADPVGKKVEAFIVYINPGNNTFSQSFIAGESDSGSTNEHAYDLEGDYTVSLNYLTPASQLESVELVFEYHNNAATTITPSTNSTATPSAAATTTTTPTLAINDTSSADAGDVAQSSLSPEGSLAQVASGNQTMNLETPRQQYLSAWNKTAFSSRFNVFIEEGTPLGYGIYREHVPANVFRPGETIMLYLEPVGYGHKQIAISSSQDGAGDNSTSTTLYLTNITADYIISDPNGTELQKVTDVPVANSTSHKQNTEMFLALPLTQDRESSSSPVGDYIITYVVNDQVSGQGFQLDKRITIADNTTATASNSTLPANNNSSNSVQPPPLPPPAPLQQQPLQEEPLSAVGQLDAAIDVEDNPIVMGNTQVITVSVSNATTDERIADANVEATVSHGTDFTRSFEGITNSDGEYTFDLNIDENAPTGEFTTSVDVSAAG